jgi:hypothetical protein
MFACNIFGYSSDIFVSCGIQFLEVISNLFPRCKKESCATEPSLGCFTNMTMNTLNWVQVNIISEESTIHTDLTGNHNCVYPSKHNTLLSYSDTLSKNMNITLQMICRTSWLLSWCCFNTSVVPGPLTEYFGGTGRDTIKMQHFFIGLHCSNNRILLNLRYTYSPFLHITRIIGLDGLIRATDNWNTSAADRFLNSIHNLSAWTPKLLIWKTRIKYIFVDSTTSLPHGHWSRFVHSLHWTPFLVCMPYCHYKLDVGEDSQCSLLDYDQRIVSRKEGILGLNEWKK